MKKPYFINIICAGIFLLAPTLANAELFDRGNGLIYDSEQDITWLQDANYAQTSGYDSDGKMSVSNATLWAENLVYAGIDDWRLPTTSRYNDPSCPEDVRATIYKTPLFYEHHIDCLGGEMERLTASADPYRNPIFENVRNSRYWTSTIYRDEVDICVEEGYCVEGDNGKRRGFIWQWDFNTSIKTTLRGGNSRYVWLVHDGDVDDTTPPPPPPPPVDPEAAIGEITTNFYVPSFDDGSINLTVEFIYHSSTDQGENLWTLQEVGVNTPEILDNPNTGTYISPTQIYLPSVIYRSIDANLNIEVNLSIYDTVDGVDLWRLDSYEENPPVSE